MDFFHSVKKVDHLCIKEDLGYFDKDVALHSFLQGKKICNFVFSLICMIYKWRGDFIGGNFPKGVIFSGEKFWGVISTWGSFHRGQFSGG